MRKCERCTIPATSMTDRFCDRCRTAALNEMRENRYLDPKTYGHVGQNRTGEQRENTYDTKHGTDR
jgi:hypothetical protein